MSIFEEVLRILELVAKVNRSVILPVLERKTGLTIVSHGRDLSEVVTQTDLNVSTALLDGIDGVVFSEEQDNPARQSALEVIQVDPIDGTGDWVASCRSKQVMSPFTLVSKLKRGDINDLFEPVAALLFDALHQFAMISDRRRLGLYCVDDQNGRIVEVDYELLEPPNGSQEKPIFINRRTAYPSLTFDGPFIDFLRKQGMRIQKVNTGGAAEMGLRVFRNFLRVTSPGLDWLNQLKPLTIIFNTEGVWKTWDTNPLDAIADALGMPTASDMYGQPLAANAAAQKLTDMYHRTGYVLSTSQVLQQRLCQSAIEFESRNPDCPLSATNYTYKDAILAMAQA